MVPQDVVIDYSIPITVLILIACSLVIFQIIKKIKDK